MVKNQKKDARPFGVAFLEAIPESVLSEVNGGHGNHRCRPPGGIMTMAVSVPRRHCRDFSV